MKIIFLIIFLTSSIFAISQKQLIGSWEMSNIDDKRANIIFGLYTSFDDPFEVEFKEDGKVKYHGDEFEDYYLFEADKIFVSKHKPVNGKFLNTNSINIYEIERQIDRKDTNGKECYEILILQKALSGIYSKRSNQKLCR